MTHWHWVRHGPTHQKTFVGWRDVPADLSDAAQINRLSNHLPGNAMMISSDLIRCVATADALARPTRHRLAHDADLRELDFGDWDGMHFQDVAAKDPTLSRAYWETPGDIAPPNGESWNTAAARIGGVVDRLNAAHPEAHIIAVAHFGAILTQVQRAMGIKAAEVMAHKIDNLSVTTMTHNQGTWQMGTINHLP